MMPINKRLKRELKKNFAKYFFIGLVLFMGITIISAFFTATDGIMSTIESQQSDCNIEDANVTLVSQLSDDNISRLHEIGINDLDVTALDDSHYTMHVFRVLDSVDKLTLIVGELPANDKQIVLESKTASAKDLSVGDEIDVDGKNYTLSGIVAVVDYNNVLQTVSSGVSNLKTFGLGFVSKQAFDGLDSAKMTIQYSLTAEDEQSIDDAYNYLMDEEIAVNILKQRSYTYKCCFCSINGVYFLCNDFCICGKRQQSYWYIFLNGIYKMGNHSTLCTIAADYNFDWFCSWYDNRLFVVCRANW